MEERLLDGVENNNTNDFSFVPSTELTFFQRFKVYLFFILKSKLRIPVYILNLFVLFILFTSLSIDDADIYDSLYNDSIIINYSRFKRFSNDFNVSRHENITFYVHNPGNYSLDVLSNLSQYFYIVNDSSFNDLVNKSNLIDINEEDGTFKFYFGYSYINLLTNLESYIFSNLLRIYNQVHDRLILGFSYFPGVRENVLGSDYFLTLYLTYISEINFVTSMVHAIFSESNMYNILEFHGISLIFSDFVWFVILMLEVIPANMILFLIVRKFDVNSDFILLFLYMFISLLSMIFSMSSRRYVKGRFLAHVFDFIDYAGYLFLHRIRNEENLSTILVLIIIFFVPSSNLSLFIISSIDGNTLKNSFNFNNLSYTHIVSYRALVLMQIFSLIFYLIVYLLLCLFKERKYASSPMKWSQKYNKTAWISLYNGFLNRKLVYNHDAPIISCNYVKFKHNDATEYTLKGVSMNVNKGDVIILIGPNGSGKTTLLNSLLGINDIEEGNIDIFGHNINVFYSTIRNMIGVCFQNSVLYDYFTLQNHLMLFVSLHYADQSVVIQKYNEILEKYEFSSIANQYCINLSGGNKRKLNLAIALLGSHDLLLLDEPTSGVDPKFRRDVWNILHEHRNTTKIITVHSMEEAESICSKIFVINNGTILHDGTPARLRQIFNCRYKLTFNSKLSLDIAYEDIKNYIQVSEIDTDDEKFVFIPKDQRIIDILRCFETRKSQNDNFDYILSVESLESCIVRSIEQDGDSNAHLQTDEEFYL